MAISISSCLKPSPPPSPPLTKPHLPPTRLASKKEEVSWRTRCVSTVACVIIGSTTAGFAGDGGVLAAAGEPSSVEAVAGGKMMRWSDKRRCPPWHVNSLENIVPENLPRPSARQRSHGLAAYQTAPAVGASLARYDSSWFSL